MISNQRTAAFVLRQDSDGISYYEIPNIENSDYFVVEFQYKGIWQPVIDAQAYPSPYYATGAVEAICRHTGSDPESLRIVRVPAADVSKFRQFNPES